MRRMRYDPVGPLLATDCDVVVSGTPGDLARLIASGHPLRQALYDLREVGEPTLADVLAPHVSRWQ
jgi:predicted GTPase